MEVVGERSSFAGLTRSARRSTGSRNGRVVVVGVLGVEVVGKGAAVVVVVVVAVLGFYPFSSVGVEKG